MEVIPNNYEKVNYKNIENKNYQLELEGNKNTNNDKITFKKNRTLQFYKFLFYTIKLEIKVTEFIELIRFSNQSEISIWIISIVLYSKTSDNFESTFVWIHLLHILRGLTGMLIMLFLPRTYEITEKLKILPEKEFRNKIFNDIIRHTINIDIITKIKKMKIYLIIYASLTIINFILDIIDFLNLLSKINDATITNDFKVILFSFFIISILYIIIDLSYIFYGFSLKYYFPENYIKPIKSTMFGTVKSLITTFKINKKETDVKSDAEEKIKNENRKEVEHIQIDIMDK